MSVCVRASVNECVCVSMSMSVCVSVSESLSLVFAALCVFVCAHRVAHVCYRRGCSLLPALTLLHLPLLLPYPCVSPMCRVAQNESTNLMGPENLAIIFAPSLFRPKKPPKPQDLVKELAKAQEWVSQYLSCVHTYIDLSLL